MSRAKQFILSVSGGAKAEQWLEKNGFNAAPWPAIPSPTHRRSYYRSYRRPKAMSPQFQQCQVVLDVSVVGQDRDEYEIGLCTMCQHGHDYPDIWLGRFAWPTARKIVLGLMGLLQDAMDDTVDEKLLEKSARYVVQWASASE